jgi:uncharacterized protein (DUF1330 family)
MIGAPSHGAEPLPSAEATPTTSDASARLHAQPETFNQDDPPTKEDEMNVENRIYPTFEQLQPLLGDADRGPIAMVNLLKFRDMAAYADGRPDEISGREAYMRYVEAMRTIVEAAGGRFLFSGEVQGLVIGHVDELWDAVGIAEYPSRAAFHSIAISAEVQAIGVHREAGLAGQLLLLTVGGPLGP